MTDLQAIEVVKKSLETVIDTLDSYVDERVKTRVSSIEIVCNKQGKRPYYEIKYMSLEDNQIHIGFSSYNLDMVKEWANSLFEFSF